MPGRRVRPITTWMTTTGSMSPRRRIQPGRISPALTATGSRCRSFKNQKGFTLIELVVIIILIGVLAAIAVPRYVDLRDNTGRAAINLDFAEQILTTGTYVDLLCGATPEEKVTGPVLTALEGRLQSAPSYPPNGPYDTPVNEGFRGWLATARTTTPRCRR